jgi:hypothetical protein
MFCCMLLGVPLFFNFVKLKLNSMV